MRIGKVLLVDVALLDCRYVDRGDPDAIGIPVEQEDVDRAGPQLGGPARRSEGRSDTPGCTGHGFFAPHRRSHSVAQETAQKARKVARRLLS